MPALSVLLPVRDALPYLRPALASLRRQTFQDFEIIAVDDGSSDGSGEALEKAAARVPALHVIHTPPRGLPAALATALTHARGRWIARQDADDISHRRRFELQLEELRGSPETAVVGSRVRLFPAGEVGVGMRRWVLWHNALLAHQAMANEALIDSPLAHGSATMRRNWLERAGGWVDRGWPEDVDLWLRLIEAGARFSKRPEVLYAWRQHSRSATRRDPRYLRDRFDALRMEALERGVLARSRSLTLIGVGRSLVRWRAILATRRRVRVVEAPRPSPGLVENLRPPIVLVFGALAARERWRAAFRHCDTMAERGQFVFIA